MKTCMDCHNYKYCTPSARHWYFDSVDKCPQKNTDLKAQWDEFDKKHKSKREKTNES